MAGRISALTSALLVALTFHPAAEASQPLASVQREVVLVTAELSSKAPTVPITSPAPGPQGRLIGMIGQDHFCYFLWTTGVSSPTTLRIHTAPRNGVNVLSAAFPTVNAETAGDCVPVAADGSPGVSPTAGPTDPGESVEGLNRLEIEELRARPNSFHVTVSTTDQPAGVLTGRLSGPVSTNPRDFEAWASGMAASKAKAGQTSQTGQSLATPPQNRPGAERG